MGLLSEIADKAINIGTLGLVDGRGDAANILSLGAYDLYKDNIKDYNSLGDITGSNDQEDAVAAAQAQQEDYAMQALAEQRQASQDAIGYFDQFNDVDQSAIANAGFLTDPNAQFSFLENNPLYKSALDNANRVTLQAQAARGRLGSGSTLEALSGNAINQAMPLLDRQNRNIAGMLDFARGNATSRANARIGEGSNVSNLLQGVGNSQAASTIGQANIAAGDRQALLGLAGTAAGAYFGGPLGGAAGGSLLGGGGGTNLNYDYDFNSAF